MTACEFLHCTLTELPEKCSNPADYLTIIAYINQKGEKEKASMPKIPKI
jgi:hypothetical protein